MPAARVPPRRLFALAACLVLGIGCALAVLQGGDRSLTSLVIQGGVEALGAGLIAAPFAAVVSLLGGTGPQSALRGVTAWAVAATVLLVLLAATGPGLIEGLNRFRVEQP